METFYPSAGIITAVCYLLVSLGYCILFRSERPGLRIAVRIAAALSVLFHLGYLFTLAGHLGRLPLASMFEASTVTAFVIALTYCIIQFTSGVSGTGIFIFPVVFLLQAVSVFTIEPVDSFNPVLQSPFFAVHILPSIMGYAAFMIAMLYSLMYVLLHAQIKSRKFGLIFDRLPSLEALDKLNSRAVVIGFLLLTGGITAGAVWAHQAWDNVSLHNPKLIISNLLWLVYGVAICLRLFFGWQGRRFATVLIAGGALLLVSFFII